ncbi:MAG: D-alanyl-D-alanine carboxypeptidase/D-alanyl-D-alanine-endopeptidase [Limnohabitans sp.]|nr:D-alanyl-D-alanine carboxypeptidase/D-alanyl-D-alanine-endopeptidase [Limnohabitans sp.]
MLLFRSSPVFFHAGAQWRTNAATAGLALTLLALSGISAAKPPPSKTAPANAPPKAEHRLPPAVLQALRQAQVPPSAISVHITPVGPAGMAANTASPSTPRLAHHPDEARNPASVMKLITTWAGLSLLGPDFVWRNRVYADGPVRDGVLHGNLVLRGSGDPKLVVERLQDLMARITAAGVREVRGDIVLDHSVFDLPPRREAFDDEPLRPYNVGPDGLLLNFKAVIYTFSPDEAAGLVRVKYEPPLAGFDAPTELPLSKGPCNDWRSQLRADFSQPHGVRFAGAYPASCGERPWPVAFAVPEVYAPKLIQALWLGAGGRLTGQVRDGSVPANARLLLEAPSLPLPEVIADINKFSNNVMAQQLFLTLSSELGSPGRFEASRLRLSRWWREQFAGLPEPVLDNGSGLSRTERSSARGLTAVLHAANASPQAQVFQNSLSVAGVDGTAARLRERNPYSPLIGQAWLKTGTLRDVVSVAGYVQGQSGQRYAVVALINHPNAPQARPALDQLLEWTVRDANDLAREPVSAKRQRQSSP